MPKTIVTGTIIFREEVRHAGHRFAPGVPIKFEDPDAAPYFVKCGWAEPTSLEPVQTFEQGEVDIDPDTMHQGAGMRVADMDRPYVPVEGHKSVMQVDNATASSGT